MASSVKQFETMFIPGILQTQEYARAVLANAYGESTTVSVDAMVELRTRRQELLDLENGPKFCFVLDESVIGRTVGSNSGHQQLFNLISVAENPNVAIEILPFSAGIHAGMKGSFEIIEFADDVDGNVVYAENSRDNIFNSDTGVVKKHQDTFQHLEKLSLGPQDSLALLREAADRAK